MNTESLGRAIAELFDEQAPRIEVDELIHRPSPLSTRAAGIPPVAIGAVAFALVILAGVLVARLGPASEPVATTIPSSSTVTTGQAPEESPTFVPETHSADDLAYVSLTLLDGSPLTLAYPEDLDLTSHGVEVQTVGSIEGTASRVIQARYGSPESFIAHAEEESGPAHLAATFSGTDNGTVELWEFEDDTIRYLVYDFEPWTVYVWDGRGENMGEAAQTAWAANLRGDTYTNGFLVLSANPPLELVPAEAAAGPDGPDIRIDGASGGLLVFINDCERMTGLNEEAYGSEVFAFCDEATNTLFFVSGSADVQQRVHEQLQVDPPPPGVSDAEAPPLDQQTNSQVFLSNDFDLAVVDIDEGGVAVDRVPELAPGDPLYRLVRRGDKLVFYGQTDLGPAVYTMDVTDPTAPPRLIEPDAWFFVPAADEGRIWAAGLDPSSPETVRALESLRETSVETGEILRVVAPPEGRWPVAAVTDGLLFQGDDALEIWDPDTQEFVGSLPGPFPVAAWRNRVVTCGSCDQITLTDLDNATQRTIDVPVGVAAIDGYNGSFSPDGRWVAVTGFLTLGPITDETKLVTVLIDFDNGSASVIPGSTTLNGVNFPLNAWNAQGDWLFMGPLYDENDTGTLLAYRPGDDTAYRVPGALTGTFYAMAAN